MTTADRLAAIRRRYNGPTIPMPQEDVAYLLSVAERATALLDALQASGEADCAYAIRRWVQRDETDLDRYERPVYDSLVSLQNALGEGAES